MPSPSFSRSIKFGGKQCYTADPEKYPQAAGLANSYFCPLGSSPGVGYVLMGEGDAQTLLDSGAAGTARSLEIKVKGDGGFPSKTLTINNLYPISARRIGGGGEHSQGMGAANPYGHASLVQFADVRYFLYHFSASDKILANVKEYQLPTSAGGTSVVSGTSSADWQAFINTIWGKLPSGLAGTAPTLPGGYTPASSPAGWMMFGGNAWKFLHRVLAKINCTTKFDPTATSNPFSIVELGATQSDSAFPVGTTYVYRNDLMLSAAARAPEKLRVNFHKQFTAQPEWSATRMGQWLTDNPVYKVDVATGITGAITGTLLELWDDMIAETDAAGTVSNSAALSTQATARKTEWVKLRNKSATQFAQSHQVAVGAQTIYPGSEVMAVWWRELGGQELDNRWRGLQTEAFRGIGPPKSPEGFDIVGDLSLMGVLGSQESEVLAPPDLARRTWPNREVVVGVAKGAIPKGSTLKSMKVYDGTPGSETYTGRDIDNLIVNKLGDIADGKWVEVEWRSNGAFYVVNGECA